MITTTKRRLKDIPSTLKGQAIQLKARVQSGMDRVKGYARRVRLRKRAARVWRVLWEVKSFRFLLWIVVFTGLAQLVLNTLPLADQLRITGLILQLGGIGQVAIGLRDTRKLFGMSSLKKEVGDLGRKVVEAFQLKEAPVARYLSFQASLPLESHMSMHKTPKTTEEWIDYLKWQVSELREEMRGKVNKLQFELKSELSEEQKERKSEIARIEQLQREFSVGGISLEIAGVVCLAIGIILSTIPGEIASLF